MGKPEWEPEPDTVSQGLLREDGDRRVRAMSVYGVAAFDDRDEHPACITDGCDNPRPRRTNWERVARAGRLDPGFAVASHHHLCQKCYEAPARVNLLAECRSTPSQRLVKRRVDHPCAVCECTVQRGECSWNCTLYGPRTFRVCVVCIDETHRDRDNAME